MHIRDINGRVYKELHMKHTDNLTDNYYNKEMLLYFSIFFGIIGLLSKIVYRPFIISLQINDFNIQGFAPNLFAALSLCLFTSFWTKTGTIKRMIFITIGLLAYEIEQYWTDRTFDILDIIATIIRLVISILIFNIFVKMQKKES
jgi:hypothetical protein